MSARLVGCLLAAILTLAPVVPGIGEFEDDGREDLVSRYVREGKVWEPHVVAALREFLHDGCVAVDAGAHIGFHTVTMAKLVSPGMVLAFEPQGDVHAELQRNLQLNGLTNVLPLRYALTDQNRLMEMEPRGKRAGIVRVGHGGEAIVGRTLDSFPISGLCLMKIDVEGHMVEVLRGAKETILREKPVIVIEIGPPKMAATRAVLEEYGYDLEHLGSIDFLARPVQ